jgi:HAE1 family hydrophobic/amphiphilic exporter-1
VPGLFVIFQSLQEKFKPMKFEDDDADVDTELLQYTQPMEITNKDYVK